MKRLIGGALSLPWISLLAPSSSTVPHSGDVYCEPSVTSIGAERDVYFERSEMTLEETQERLRAFRDERDWAQFHNAKDLAAAIAIEGGELQELFLWKQADELDEVLGERRSE